MATKTRDLKRFVDNMALVVLLMGTGIAEGKAGTPPILPKQYQGSGTVLQALLNQSWPAAQGLSATFTFFAPQNSAVKKYPCLFSESATVSKAVATNVLQYHIIPGKTLSYQQLKNLAQNADYMSTTAFNGKKLNVTLGGNKLNGYSSINYPDIGTKQSQAIHGIKTLLVPPGLTIGCGPPAPSVRGGNHSAASTPYLYHCI
ncbi:hypothetical protein KC19_VG263100 [Ceratodon purpureus]|uniref:FAS1 domain-containing protein n=1 Tax=Ceratodon purpureus TaxID=3225 RepID=A0A8T0HTU5_CERPU|nr:hypothetical protein KC19_VG263100 [Ceratodon purpureus]